MGKGNLATCQLIGQIFGDTVNFFVFKILGFLYTLNPKFSNRDLFRYSLNGNLYLLSIICNIMLHAINIYSSGGSGEYSVYS